MATYNITEDPNNKWVKLITINTKNDIDISNEVFNITVKDQLEYFIGSHIKEGSTFELEELFKKDTFPTLEISNNAVKYIKQKCFTCAPYNTDMDYDTEHAPTTVPCPDCNGKGKTIKNKCPHCNGEGYKAKKTTVEVKIPAGIASHQQLRIAGKGERGYNGGPNGDLYIEIIVNDHPQFKRDGSDIHVEVPISFADAALGCTIDVPTAYGDVELIDAPTKMPEQTKIKEVREPYIKTNQ